ncbi:aminoglycoside phosphotransferase family protein [Streptomyces sp. NPDC060194]|uniref:aminoglycoside phosphotransferase family protein n=1 Tax=Streptomyces sp. NPDC060194 TaxID=3347069 RepID=UPI0036584BEF
MPDETVLQDGPHRRVVRIGDTVRRPTHPWTPAVHHLLRHLAAVGFPYAPRVLGLDAEGREILTYQQGASGPDGWAEVVDDAGLTAFARLLRAYHDAVEGFRLPDGLTWCTGESGPTGDDVVCHLDFGPWNTVWDGPAPTGILDWDYARPAPRIHYIAYALEYTAPFRDDGECLRWLRHPAPPDRRHRIELFADAYGLTSTDGLADAVVAAQESGIALVRDLAARGLEPQSRWVAGGYLDELAGRVAWSRAHRHLFT